MKRSISFTLLLFLGFLALVSTASAQKPFEIDDSMSMEDFKAEVLTKKDEVWVVDFWASWCGPCMQIIPEIKEIHKNLDGESVRFVSVAWDRNETAWRRGINYTRMPWAQVLVPDIRNAPFIEEHFPHKAIPTLFMVTPEGKVKKVDESTLERKVRKELKKID